MVKALGLKLKGMREGLKEIKEVTKGIIWVHKGSKWVKLVKLPMGWD